ncbi:MAG: hypothetical protein IK045_05045 [Bacteroidales bacterium]|nr:hypothetical protein [Bacteroidales bacterium]
MKKTFLLFLAVLAAVLSFSCKKTAETKDPDGKTWALIYDNEGAYFEYAFDLSLGSGNLVWTDPVFGRIEAGKTYLYNKESVHPYIIEPKEDYWKMVMSQDDFYETYSFKNMTPDSGILENAGGFQFKLRRVAFKTEYTTNLFSLDQKDALDKCVGYMALTNDLGLAKLKALKGYSTEFQATIINGEGIADDYEGKDVHNHFVVLKHNTGSVSIADKCSTAALKGAAAIILFVQGGQLYTRDMMDSLPADPVIPVIFLGIDDFTLENIDNADKFVPGV